MACLLRFVAPALLLPALFLPALCFGSRANAGFGNLPLSFEANRGQFDPRVSYAARGEGFILFLTGGEAVFSLSGAGSTANVRMRFPGSPGPCRLDPLDPLPGRSHYLTGRGPRDWKTGIPNYGRVACRGIYPGVTLVYYGNQRRVEYDLVVGPGRNPKDVQVEFSGAESLRLDGGDLVLHTSAGALRQHAPLAFQDGPKGRRNIPVRYALRADHRVAFEIGAHDPSLPIRIDPILSYSTFLGGDGAVTGGHDYGRAIAVDLSGNVYVAGSTQSTQFPVTDGAIARTNQGSTDGFVTKFDPSGATRIYSTYLGGNSIDEVRGIAVDPSGNAYVTGATSSNRFPTTTGALQTSPKGGGDCFVAKLNQSGTALVYSTLLGGNSIDTGAAIGIDSAGNAFVTGQTSSTDFPVTPGAFQKTLRSVPDAFFARINSSGTALLYATFLGGGYIDDATSLAVDQAGNAVVGGTTSSTDFPVTAGALRKTAQADEGFAVRFPAGSESPAYSTLIGGIWRDAVYGVALDVAGNAFLVGSTGSTDFPVVNSIEPPPFAGGLLDPVRYLREILREWRFLSLSGGQDAFVLRLNAEGTQILRGVFLGGGGTDTARSVWVDPSGRILVVAGETDSRDLPVTRGARQSSFGGGAADGFVATLNFADFQLRYLTYLGGASEDRIYSAAGTPASEAWVTGVTISADFPVTLGAWGGSLTRGGFDSFASRLDPLGSTLAFSSFLGGGGSSDAEAGNSISVDATGNAYVTGTTISTDFPVNEGALQNTPGGNSNTDVFVTKIDPAGKNIVYSTYFGGSDKETGTGIAVDAAGSAYVVGVKGYGTLPCPAERSRGSGMAFVVKLSPMGSDVAYCYSLGGNGYETSAAVAVDGSGSAYVTGATASANFPVTPGALQAVFKGQRDAFITKVDPNGTALLYSTFLGGSGFDDPSSIAIDSSGNVYVAGMTTSQDFPATAGAYQTRFGGGGWDTFVVKLNAGGASLGYATYLGGDGNDEVYGIAGDPAGNTYLAGQTTSANFPTTEGSFTVAGRSFVTKLNAAGSAIVFSNRLAEGNDEAGRAVAVDSSGNVVVAGRTTSAGLRVSEDAFQVALRGQSDGFLMKLDPAGKSLLYGTFLGGSGPDTAASVALDSAGNAYLTGQTGSADFPATAESFQPGLRGPRNAFVAKVDFSQTSPIERPVITKVVNFGSGGTAVAPGCIIEITGQRLAKQTAEAGKPIEIRATPLPVQLGGTTVAVPGRVLPLFSVSADKIVAQLPYSVAIDSQTFLTVAVDGVSSRSFGVTPRGMAPGILAVYKQDGTLNTPTNLLHAGDTMIAYLTGGGRTNPPVSSGVPAPSTQVEVIEKPQGIILSKPATPQQGTSGELKSFTLVPGLVGVAQAAILIPKHTDVGEGNKELDLTLTWNDVQSNRFRFYVLGSPD
ncbi:MAG TPA: SBBP repeat-containing protein [Bryobacteraceae bacterium]|nr:SBBP repeat-containing protein [Bryobacteraceae bacterium]